MPSASRLLARSLRCGHWLSRASASSAQAPMRCSQLSRISNSCLPRRKSASDSKGERPGCWRAAQRGGDGLHHQARVGQRGELHQPGAIGEAGQGLGRHLERQARLAGAARAGEGEQRRFAQQAVHFGDLALPADKVVSWTGRLCGAGAQRAQGWKVGWQARRRQLEDMLGAAEVFEPMLAQVAQLGAGGIPSRTRPAVTCESKIWPPWPTAISRAVRLSVGPK